MTKEVLIEYADVLGTWGVVFATSKQKALRSSFRTAKAAREAIAKNNADPDRLYDLVEVK